MRVNEANKENERGTYLAMSKSSSWKVEIHGLYTTGNYITIFIKY